MNRIKAKLILFMFSISVLKAMEEKEASSEREQVSKYVNLLPEKLREKIDYVSFEQIPKELKEIIAKFLISNVTNAEQAKNAVKDLAKLSQVNAEFRKIINNENFWEYIINTLIEKTKMSVIEVAIMVVEGGLVSTSIVVDWLKKNVESDNIDAALTEALLNKEFTVAKFLVRAGGVVNKIIGRRMLSQAIEDDNKALIEFLTYAIKGTN